MKMSGNQDATTQLQSCLRMLESASSDNEKMAGLLLFTHLTRNATMEMVVDSNKLFKAIDVKFLVRLLHSTNVPEGCPEFMYKSLALNVLSSFKENDVLFHPMVVSSLTTIAEGLTIDKSLAEAAQMLDDTTAILLIFSRKAVGCKHLLKSNCLPIICNAIIENPESDSLFEILKGILFHLPGKSWGEKCSQLSSVCEYFSTQFAKNQDLLKFSACEKLLVLVTSLCESQCGFSSENFFLTKWKDEIRSGLNDILQARCKVEYKYTALKLTRCMIDLLGIEWTVTSNEQSVLDISNSKFWLLTLSILKTELRLILEPSEEDEIDRKSDIIVSCYAIIEKTIEFLICDKDKGRLFGDEIIMKIHSILTETFDCIIQFLIQLDSQEAIGQTPFFRKPIIIATVRVLCVWLSEETNMLSDKISNVLPVLIKWAKLSANNGNDSTSNEILLHLLPPLCHLSADESFCAILVKEESHVLLANTFNQLWQKQKVENVNYPSHLVTLCNVFLNFSVLEVELIKSNKVFKEILECIMASVPQVVSSTLKAHFVLLGLILFRHRFQLHLFTVRENKFVLNCISFLREVHLSLTAKENSCVIDWENLSELWFLSVQNLVACAKTIPAVSSLVQDSGWVEEIQSWVKISNETSNSLFKDLQSALLPLVNLE